MLIKGIVSDSLLPSAGKAQLIMGRLSKVYGENRQGMNLPQLRDGFSIPAENRTLQLSVSYLHNDAEGEYGITKGSLAAGAPRQALLSNESTPPNFIDKGLNVNLVTSLRRDVEGGIFDREVDIYPIVSFLPSDFYYLEIDYTPALTGQNEVCFLATTRFSFPMIALHPGKNVIGFPDGLVEGLNDQPFYAPTLKDWDKPGLAAYTYAQSMILAFVPVDQRFRHKSGLGDIVMLRLISLAGSFDDMPFGEYLSELRLRMGIDLPQFLNYPK